jgi:predicted molibdopterin-dependent oxidoreductase YjgC
VEPNDPPRIKNNRIVHHPERGSVLSAQTVRIIFDGRLLDARAGEPIAAALLANGVRVFRTMPRTGEARGGYCMIGRCSDCLMKVDGELNVRACVTPVKDGMNVETQHGLGEFDRGPAL